MTSPQSTSDEGGLNLGQVFAAIRRQALLVAGVTVVVAALAPIKTLSSKPIYSSSFEILTKSVTVEAEVLSSVPQTLTSRQQENTSAEPTIDATKIRVLQSPALLDSILEKLKPRYPDLTYQAIASNLQIKVDGQNILSVSFSNENPKLVKDMAEVLSKVYLNYSLEERQKDVRQGILFVEEQLPILESRVANRQEKLQRLRQDYNLIDPELQAKNFSEQAATLAQQRLETQTQLNEARLLYAELQRELGRPIESAAASALSNNSRYQKLLDQLLDLDSKLAQDSALYLNSSPELQVLQDQRRNLVPLLQQEGGRVQRELASHIQELSNREQALSQSIAGVNQQVKQLSMITRQYTDVQRDLQIATDNLNQFLTKREALRIDAAQRQVPWQLLTPPGDPIPSSASLKRSLLLGSILGLLLGMGAALVAERLSNVIRTTKDIKDISRFPLLGSIPFYPYLKSIQVMRNTTVLSEPEDALSELMNHGDPDYSFPIPFHEAFRSLYTNLCLMDPDTPLRSVVISSPTPENGKTTIAMHLAQAAAAMGRRVLLVDTDLRRPRMHQYLNLPNRQGLTDLIATELHLLDAVQNPAWEQNLFVLTCGSIPPDPTRILASQAMQSLMEKAVEVFDLVVYDTPPILGFADATLLAAHTDALLIVARLNYLKRFYLEQALDELKVSLPSIVGIIANASEPQAFASHSYYQQYTDSFESSASASSMEKAGVRPSGRILGQLKKLIARR